MYKIKAIIVTEDEKKEEIVKGTFIDDIISYQETNNTNVYLDINKNELIRENKDILMKYIFIKNRRSKGTIFIKEMNKKLEVEIETDELIKKDNYYYIKYKIEENKFEYEVSYTEE